MTSAEVSEVVDQHARGLLTALMLLSVFAGITMFGPWGIVIGPVLMIVIVTTIDVYLAVYQGVELENLDDQDGNHDRKPGWRTRWKRTLNSGKTRPGPG